MLSNFKIFVLQICKNNFSTFFRVVVVGGGKGYLLKEFSIINENGNFENLRIDFFSLANLAFSNF